MTVSGAIVSGVLVGALLGCFNGFAITRFNLPPFVATLGMLSIARGLTMLWTGGFPITRLGDSFGFIGSGRLFGLSMPVWISAALVALFVLVMNRTRFGKHVYAVGGSEKAARLSGLNVRRTNQDWAFFRLHKIWILIPKERVGRPGSSVEVESNTYGHAVESCFASWRCRNRG